MPGSPFNYLIYYFEREMNYISISLFKKVVNHALAEGMSRDDFKGLPTSPDDMEKLQAVPADHFFELHEKVDAVLGPGFSVRVGQQMVLEDYGVLGLSWKTCSWAGEIFHRCERYFKLLSNTYVFQVKKQKDNSRVYLYRDAYRRGVALSNEATFSAAVVVLRAITDSNISPVTVSFKHQAPVNQDSYQVFQCPISFKQQHNFIEFRTTDLEMRTAKADTAIHKFLVDQVEEETKVLEINAHKIAREVEGLIKDALPSGIPSIGQLGESMGMSSRTLSRRLAENGMKFRDLIKNTQIILSTELLKNTPSSIGEIAFQTGFSDQSAFNRAFKKWTGKSPLEYRKDANTTRMA